MRTPTLGRHATNAKESAHPERWRGRVLTLAPALGVQGSKLFDMSGYGNHATLENMDPATDWVNGKTGYAVDLDGADDYINVPTSPSLEVADSYTLSMLIYPRSISSFQILFVRGTSAGDDIEFYLHTTNGLVLIHNRNTAGTLEFAGDDISSNVSGPGNWGTLNLNSWNDLVITKGGGEWKVYKDGIQAGNTVTGVDNPTTAGNPWTFGFSDEPVFGDNDNANCIINIVSIHDRVLSASEIFNDYLNPLAPFELKRRPVAFVPAAVAAGNPWYYYANQN